MHSFELTGSSLGSSNVLPCSEFHRLSSIFLLLMLCLLSRWLVPPSDAIVWRNCVVLLYVGPYAEAPKKCDILEHTLQLAHTFECCRGGARHDGHRLQRQVCTCKCPLGNLFAGPCSCFCCHRLPFHSVWFSQRRVLKGTEVAFVLSGDTRLADAAICHIEFCTFEGGSVWHTENVVADHVGQNKCNCRDPKE